MDWSWVIAAVVVVAVGGVGYYVVTRMRTAQRGTDADSRVISATQEIGFVVALFALFGAVALGVACFGLPDSEGDFFALYGVDMLIGGAAGSLGALLGFIFGVPRTVADTRPPAAGDEGGTRMVLGANTNLERVSDWLTTLLIGATLVQIKDLPVWIKSLSEYVGASPGLTNAKIIPFISLYFFVLAFLGVYLITRLYLTGALNSALSFISAAGGVASQTLLGERLNNAVADGTPEELRAALDLYFNFPLTDAQRKDPALNARAATALARYIATGKATDVAARREQLKTAVGNAAADPQQKASLQQALQAKRLTSGDQTVDQELLKLVA